MGNFDREEFEPEDWVKVRASTDGQQSFLTWNGSIYSFVPGEPKQHLFKMVGMSVARCIANPDGTWDLISRELSFYLDPSTGERLNSWKNPWTGEIVPVVHVANNLVQRFLNRRFPAIVGGDTTTFVVDLFANYPNPLADDPRFAKYSPQPFYQAAELFKFTVPTAELRNPQTISVSQMILAWDRIGPWLPWMKMGDPQSGSCLQRLLSGHLIYSAWGGKVASFSDLPQLLRDEIHTRVPLYKNVPQCKLDREDMTSWQYFKQHFDAYLRAEVFPIPEFEAQHSNG